MEGAQQQEAPSQPLQPRPRPKWVPKFRAASERKADEAASENDPAPPQQPEAEAQQPEAAAEAEADGKNRWLDCYHMHDVGLMLTAVLPFGLVAFVCFAFFRKRSTIGCEAG